MSMRRDPTWLHRLSLRKARVETRGGGSPSSLTAAHRVARPEPISVTAVLALAIEEPDLSSSLDGRSSRAHAELAVNAVNLCLDGVPRHEQLLAEFEER